MGGSQVQFGGQDVAASSPSGPLLVQNYPQPQWCQWSRWVRCWTYRGLQSSSSMLSWPHWCLFSLATLYCTMFCISSTLTFIVHNPGFLVGSTPGSSPVSLNFCTICHWYRYITLSLSLLADRENAPWKPRVWSRPDVPQQNPKFRWSRTLYVDFAQVMFPLVHTNNNTYNKTLRRERCLEGGRAPLTFDSIDFCFCSTSQTAVGVCEVSDNLKLFNVVHFHICDATSMLILNFLKTLQSNCQCLNLNNLPNGAASLETGSVRWVLSCHIITELSSRFRSAVKSTFLCAANPARFMS